MLGENNNKIGNNSNLPAIISIVKTSLEKLEKVEKLPTGPIIDPNPGPTLFKHVSDAVMVVSKSIPGIFGL